MGLRRGWQEAKLLAAIQRGRKLIREERDDEFRSFCRGAARRFPQSAEIQYMLALTFVGERPDEEVAAQAVKAAEIGARDPAIQVRAGFLLMNSRDVEAARVCAARAEESADEDFVLSADLEGLKGRIAARDGDFAAAEEKFRSVLHREPQWSSHWVQLARFLWARGRDEEALTVVAESLSRFRDDGDGSRNRPRDIKDLERLQSEILERDRA